MKGYRVRIAFRSCTRSYATTPTRPFTFHVGASFVGKPAHPEDKPPKTKGFPEGPIKQWRDQTLAWPKGLISTQAGHDFFYVQEVGSPYINGKLVLLT
jgi:protein phosphatase PTC7